MKNLVGNVFIFISDFQRMIQPQFTLYPDLEVRSTHCFSIDSVSQGSQLQSFECASGTKTPNHRHKFGKRLFAQYTLVKTTGDIGTKAAYIDLLQGCQLLAERGNLQQCCIFQSLLKVSLVTFAYPGYFVVLGIKTSMSLDLNFLFNRVTSFVSVAYC